MVVDETPAGQTIGIFALFFVSEFRITLAVRDGNRDPASFHALEEQRRRRPDLDHGEAGFELFRPIAHKMRPVRAAGDDLVQVAHHLAAIADAERETVGAREERFELVAGASIEQDGFRPALAGAEHVSVREAAAGSNACEIAQRRPAADDVAHVHVERGESRALECGGHLDLSVDALLAQDGDPRTGAGGDHRCCRAGHVWARIECQMRRHPRVFGVENAIVFLLRGDRVVTQRLHPEGRRRPGAVQIHACFVEQRLAIVVNHDSGVRGKVSDQMHVDARQHVDHRSSVDAANLYDSAQLFAEKCRQRRLSRRNFEIDSASRRECHLAHGCKQSAVGSIVIREELPRAIQRLHRRKESRQALGRIHVRRTLTDLPMHLRDYRTAEAISTIAEIYEQQLGVRDIGA